MPEQGMDHRPDKFEFAPEGQIDDHRSAGGENREGEGGKQREQGVAFA